MRQLEDYFLEERSNRVAQPAKSSQKSENGWNSEPIEKPRFPRGTLFGAVDSLLDFLAGQFPIVGSTRFQIAQQPLLAISIAAGPHRWRLPIVPTMIWYKTVSLKQNWN
jgi:hypothetical protein